MMEDIRRICVAPTAEDRDWFPDIAGRRLAGGAARRLGQLSRREFHRQFLSPNLMREFRLFALSDKASESSYRVEAIHD